MSIPVACEDYLSVLSLSLWGNQRNDGVDCSLHGCRFFIFGRSAEVFDLDSGKRDSVKIPLVSEIILIFFDGREHQVVVVRLIFGRVHSLRQLINLLEQFLVGRPLSGKVQQRERL